MSNTSLVNNIYSTVVSQLNHMFVIMKMDLKSILGERLFLQLAQLWDSGAHTFTEDHKVSFLFYLGLARIIKRLHFLLLKGWFRSQLCLLNSLALPWVGGGGCSVKRDLGVVVYSYRKIFYFQLLTTKVCSVLQYDNKGSL